MSKEHKNHDLEKIDMQVASVEACDIEEVKGSFASLAEREDLHLDPDLMYARFIMCHEGANANGDYFTKEVLARAQHTPRFKPIDWEHGQPMVGTILESRYAEDAEGRAYIEAIGVVWKFVYPELAEQIKMQSASGGLRLSMECYYRDANYRYGEQIFDQEQAEELGIIGYVGREYMGKKVYRVFKDVVFGGVGVVENPADKEAVFLSVAKKQAQEVINNKELMDDLTDGQIKAIANIVRTTNDFQKKDLSKDTVNAVTIAKYVKAFDRAKSQIVAKFNKDDLETKQQIASEVKNIIDTLLNSVSDISNDFFVGLAHESDEMEGVVTPDLNLKVCDDCSKQVAENTKEGSENMAKDKKQEATEEVVQEQEANKEQATESVEKEVVQEEAKEQVEDKAEEQEDATDYKSEASKLEKEVSDLKAQLADKAEKAKAYDTLKKDFDELKEKVEAKEKEELAQSRMAELQDLGVEFSEARQQKELDKISAMDNDSFADYKDLLSELVSKEEKAEAEDKQEASTEEAKEEEEVEVEVENTDKSTADLNIESKPEKMIKPFGHLTE